MPYAHWFPKAWIGGVEGESSPLDQPTLTIADQADGTGATATVAGSTGGTTNTCYYQNFDGALGTDTWTDGGNRVGDGTIDVALSTGHYIAYIESTDGEQVQASNVVYFVVTDATEESVHYQCMTAVQARIRALSLTGIVNASVVVKKLPHSKIWQASDGIALPAVIITPQREQMPPRAGVTAKDDIGYGVLVTIVDSDNQERTLAANHNKYLVWRQKIAKAFRNQRLSGVSEIIIGVIEPGDPVVPTAWLAQLFASALLLRFTSREGRGLT